MFLFVTVSPTTVRLLGCVEYVGFFGVQGKDKDGKDRYSIEFQLRPIPNFHVYYQQIPTTPLL